MRQSTNASPAVLNSWKEIAQYLDHGVRTVQRWERELGLPVHRIGSGKRSPVYANVRELEFWLYSSADIRHDSKKGSALNPAPLVKKSQRPIDDSRRLLQDARALAQKIAEASIRQRKQADELQAKIVRMREKLK